MPPKPQINGYSLFIKLEGKDLLEEELGRSVGNPEAHQKCSGYWNRMTAAQKEEWKQRAKSYRHTDDWQQEREDMRERQLRRKAEEGPTRGKAGAVKTKKRVAMKAEEEERKVYSYYAEDDFEAFERKRERDRNTILEDMLWTSPAGNQEKRDEYIRKKRFFVISVVTYFEQSVPGRFQEDHVYCPAEIGIVEFNLDDGVVNDKSWKVAHGFTDQFPSNDVYFEALQRSEDRISGHGIPLRQNEEENCEDVRAAGLNFNWAEILGDIAEMVKGQKRIYCYNKDYNRIQGAIKWLKEKAMQQTGRSPASLSEEKIACFEDLVSAYLSFGKMKPNQYEIDQDQVIPDDWNRYSRHPMTRCTYHNTVNRTNCAVAHAKKLLYCLFNYFEDNGTYEVECGPGHIPQFTGDVVADVDVSGEGFFAPVIGPPDPPVASGAVRPIMLPNFEENGFPSVVSRPPDRPQTANNEWEEARPTLHPPSHFTMSPAPSEGGRVLNMVPSGDDMSNILPSEVGSRPPSNAAVRMPKKLPPRLAGRGRGTRPPSSASSVGPQAPGSNRETPIQCDEEVTRETEKLQLLDGSFDTSSPVNSEAGFRMEGMRQLPNTMGPLGQRGLGRGLRPSGAKFE